MGNTESIDEIKNYIKNNYLTIENLENQTCISVNQLVTLVNNFCIPKHSYAISKQVAFHTDIFGESIFTEEKVFYYHPSLINLAIKADQYLRNSSFIDVARKMKADFAHELCQALIEIDEAKSVFNYCFNNDGHLLMEGVERIMTEHWSYIMDGTYGVCLKEITAKNVVLKNIAVSVLEEWIKNPADHQGHLYERVQKAAELYDSIATPFAPHEIIKSTRGRLFNKFQNHHQTLISNC